jgi:hypothetical protein
VVSQCIIVIALVNCSAVSVGNVCSNLTHSIIFCTNVGYFSSRIIKSSCTHDSKALTTLVRAIHSKVGIVELL